MSEATDEGDDVKVVAPDRPNLMRGFMLSFLFVATYASGVIAIAAFAIAATDYPLWIAGTAVGTLVFSLLMLAVVVFLTGDEGAAGVSSPAPTPDKTPEADAGDDGGAEEEEEAGGQPFDAPTPSGRNSDSPDAGRPTPSGRTPPGMESDDLAGFTGHSHDNVEEDDDGTGDVPTPSS